MWREAYFPKHPPEQERRLRCHCCSLVSNYGEIPEVQIIQVFVQPLARSLKAESSAFCFVANTILVWEVVGRPFKKSVLIHPLVRASAEPFAGAGC